MYLKCSPKDYTLDVADRSDNPLRIFATKPFMRFAEQMGVSSAELWDALQHKSDADLGGGVMKYRIARPGEGTSGGGRAIVAVQRRERIFLMFGFEKKDLANIKPDELKDFRKAAKAYIALSKDALTKLVKLKTLTEIKAANASFEL